MNDQVHDLLDRLKYFADMRFPHGPTCLDAAVHIETLEYRNETLEAALRDCVAELSLCAKQLSARPDGSVSLALNKGRAALAPEKVKPVMVASVKAAEVVSGWSDAKKDYAGRAVPSTLAEGQDK